MAGKTYELAIAIGAKLSATFSRETYSASAALAGLGKQAKQLTATGRSAEKFAQLTEEVKRAEARYGTAAAALGQLKTAELAAGGATKESAKWMTAGARATKQAEVALLKARDAANKEEAALLLAGVATSRLSQEQERLARQLGATERMQRGVAGLSRAGAKIGGQVRSVLSDAARLGGVGIAAGAGLFAIAKSTAEAGVDLEKTAIRLGTTTEALQLLRSAGKKTGVDVESLDQGLGKLQVNLGKVLSLKPKGGGGSGLVGSVGEIQLLGTRVGGAKTAATDPFHHIGLSAKELAKLQPEQQVAKISDAINKLGTHAEKSAAAVQIFGRGGLSMLPLIEKGSAGLEELFAQARASGNLLSKDTIENSKKFHIALLGAEGAIGSVKNTLGAALLPVVTNVLGKFTKFVSENRGQIKEWAEKTAVWVEKKAIPAIIKFGGELKSLASKVIWLVQKGAELTGGFGNLAAVVVAIRLAPLAKTIVEIGYNAVKAAVGLGQYVAAKWSAVAATKALNDANAAGGGGVPGISPTAAANTGKGIGNAASAAMVASAALVGYQIGTFIDEKLGISEKLSAINTDKEGRLTKNVSFGLLDKLTGRDETIEKANRAGDEHAAKLAALRSLMKEQGLSYAAASDIVFRGGKPTAALQGGGAVLHFSPTYHVGSGTSREEMERQMDAAHHKAKKAALDAHAAEAKKKRRLSYG
jgi:hypothetical protein